MAVLVLNCPHCGTRNAAFNVAFEVAVPLKPQLRNLHAGCPVCFQPVAIRLHAASPTANVKDYPGDIGSERAFTVENVYPEPPKSESPEHVPAPVARSFVEGMNNLKDRRYSSSVAMFRRAIDVGTKLFSDEVNAWKLDKRIDKLAEEGLITKDLQKWAHKIRLEGNQALHELDEPSAEQTEDLALFTEMVLTYLYTLPAKVKANLGDTESVAS